MFRDFQTRCNKDVGEFFYFFVLKLDKTENQTRAVTGLPRINSGMVVGIFEIALR